MEKNGTNIRQWCKNSKLKQLVIRHYHFKFLSSFFFFFFHFCFDLLWHFSCSFFFFIFCLGCLHFLAFGDFRFVLAWNWQFSLVVFSSCCFFFTYFNIIFISLQFTSRTLVLCIFQSVQTFGAFLASSQYFSFFFWFHSLLFAFLLSSKPLWQILITTDNRIYSSNPNHYFDFWLFFSREKSSSSCILKNHISSNLT